MVRQRNGRRRGLAGAAGSRCSAALSSAPSRGGLRAHPQFVFPAGTRSMLAPRAYPAAGVRGDSERSQTQQPSCCQLPFSRMGKSSPQVKGVLVRWLCHCRPGGEAGQSSGESHPCSTPCCARTRPSQVGCEGTPRSCRLRKQGESSPLPFCHCWGRRGGLALA